MSSITSYWRSRFIALTLGLGLHFYAPGGVSGQDSSGDSPEYREFIRGALVEFQRGNFNEARAFFAQAHEISPNARTYRGLGLCSYELRNYVDAIESFEKALRSKERPLTPSMQSEAEDFVHRARTFVTRIRVTVEPAQTELRVDTRPVERDSNGYILVDPGTHELSFEATNHDTTTRTVRTAGGEQLTVRVTLAPHRTEAPQAKSPIQPITPEATHTERAAESDGSAGPWIVVGVSAAVTTTGAVFLALALSDIAAVEEPDSGMPVYDRAADDRVQPRSAIGIASLAVGGLGMIGGLIWGLGQAEVTETESTRVGVTPAGLRIEGTF